MKTITPSEIRSALQTQDNFQVSFPPCAYDPFSSEYRSFVMAQYASITGRSYLTDFEEHPITEAEPDRDWATTPWPYNTGDPVALGEHLISMGHIIRAIRPRPGERVLELGAGPGNLAIPLARLGCDVTVLEIERRYTEIIRKRSHRIGIPVKIEQKPFLEAHEIEGTYDLILFCASFHHCDDHQTLLKMVMSKLAPGGRIALCGEPMDEALPYPWGLSTSRDGVNQIVTFGWLELAFRVSYLMDLLKRAGLKPELTVCPDTAMGNVILSTRQD
jgi:protein-L-isoaspartate O-methyltransferase